MGEDKAGKIGSHWVLRALGWFLGGLSLIKLIEDLDLVKLYGALGQWSSAYGLLVSGIGRFLFGWIQWKWVKVEDVEHHVLVLAALLGGAVGRASYTTLIRRNAATPGAEAAGMALAFFVIGLLFVMLLPAPLSLWVGVTFLLLGCAGMITRDKKRDQPDVDPRDLFRESLVVGTIFLAVLAMNYAIMKP